MKLPVAEVFHSVQGEGVYTGTPMMFVRLAGCNVGRYIQAEDDRHSVCTSCSGANFVCDTDYHRYAEMTIEQLVEECYEDHVCITGGEPLLHINSGLLELVKALPAAVHVETSGTLPLDRLKGCWITCSPKLGYLEANDEYVDEFKLLVDNATKVEDLEDFVEAHVSTAAGQQVFIQPINGIKEYEQASITKCMDILRQHPEWKLSMQAHKGLELR